MLVDNIRCALDTRFIDIVKDNFAFLQLSMNSSKIIRVNQPTKKLVEKPKQADLQTAQATEVKIDIDKVEFELEQPKSEVKLESLAQSYPEDSVYGSGWSITQLREEFRGI